MNGRITIRLAIGRNTLDNMNYWKRPFLLVFLVWIISIGYTVAQDKTAEIIWAEKIFDKSNGLQDKRVQQVFEDRRGYFWLVTDASLLFFDGTNFFTAIRHRPFQEIKELSIRCQDADGRIWVQYQDGNGVGFKVFDESDRNIVDDLDFFPEGIALNAVRDVTMDEKGDFFLLTHTGELWRHSRRDQNWQREATCISADFRFAFDKNSRSGIWLITGMAIAESHRILGYWSSNGLFYHQIKDLIHIERTEFGKLVCLNKTNMGLLDEYGHFEELSLESLFPGMEPIKEEIRSYNSDFGYNRKSGDVFFSYRGQLEVANLRTGLPYKSSKRLFVPSVTAGAGIFDQDNGIWFGTLEGLKQFEYRTNFFDRIQWKDTSKDPFYHEYSIRGIASCPNGEIFFSANDYLWRYDPQLGRTDRLFFLANGTSDVIWDTINSRIWVLAPQLIGFDPFEKTYETYGVLDTSGNGYTFGLHSLGDALFVSNSSGSWLSNLRNKQFELFTAYGDFPDLKTAEIYGFFEYSPTELWLYSNQGIYSWEKGGEITAHYSIVGKGEFYIPAMDIRHIHRDENGVIWLASRQGLIRWEPKLAISQVYTEVEGLSNSNLYGIFEDDHGFLWLSSDYGIIQYHKATGVARNFTTEHGISHNEFNRVSHEQDEEGYIYFGSLNGITRFHPDDFVFDPCDLEHEKIDLISLVLYDWGKGVEVEKTSAFFADRRIEIFPGEINLHASFAVTDFDISAGVNYAYRLLNIKDNQWINMESSVLKIPTLPYGSYDIEIRARDLNLEFSDGYLRIPVRVIAPLYLRPWFIGACLWCFFVVLAWGVNREIRRRDKQNRLLQKMVAESIETIAADKQLIEAQAADLKRQHLEKDTFFATVSHEFRTPIALILGPAGLLEEKFKPGSRELGLLQTIKNNANRLLKLINDILILSKLDYSPLSLQEEAVNLKELFNEIGCEFDALFGRKQINFTTAYLEDQDIWIQSDRQFLKIILQNLLSNALKFTPAHGEVILELFVEDNRVLIQVQDSGRGIHPEDLPHIFERYYQSKWNETKVEGGTGIGLSLVRELTTALGGGVEASSTWGEGTVFRVELPVVYAAEPAIHPKGKQVIVSHEQQLRQLLPQKLLPQVEGRHLLLVDDNAEFFDFIQQILGNLFDLKYARSGKEALALLEHGIAPVMIITDLMMPEMDGLQLLARLKASAEYVNIPVVALTAMAEDQSRIDAFSLGVNDYLLKPFDARQLVTVVGHLLERYFNTDSKSGSADQDNAVWLNEIKEIIENGIASEHFSVEKLMLQVPMSKSVFYNKVKGATGLTPNQLIMEIRLQKARAYLLENPTLTNKQVMQLIGLKHEPYFIRIFSRRFGYTPGQMKN